MTASPDLQSLLSYWRNNLADKDRLGKLPDPDDKDTVRSSPQGLWAGWVEDEPREELFHAYEQEQKEEAPGALSVLVYLGILQKGVEHGKRGQGTASAPLVIPARLTRDSQLLPRGELPLVPRPLLDPHDTVDCPIIGRVADYDAFCTREEPPGEDAEWADLEAKVDGLWQAVVGESFQGVESLDAFEGFFLQNAGLVTLDTQSMGRPTSLVGLYDTLREADDAAGSAPLLADLARLERTEAEGPQALPSEEVHLAQMGGDFPLAPSQRRSLVAQQALGDGQILTINGPRRARARPPSCKASSPRRWPAGPWKAASRLCCWWPPTTTRRLPMSSTPWPAPAIRPRAIPTPSRSVLRLDRRWRGVTIRVEVGRACSVLYKRTR